MLNQPAWGLQPPSVSDPAIANALSAYAPQDRRVAGARGEALPLQAEGAVLFVDIAGFTPLTERLATTLGLRRGADALTRLLNHVYTALIAEIEAVSGSVIGFSGDAVTCWFAAPAQGGLPDAAHRALVAASGVQRAMAGFTNAEAAPGVAASLSVKCALAAGGITRALVGDPEILQLDVIAGATVDRMAAAEALAEAGELIADENLVAALAGKCSVLEWRVEGNQRFAQIEPVPASGDPPAPLPTLPNAASWVPAPVAAAIRSGHERFLAELRPAVALFVRFAGIDWERGPDAAEHLNAWIRWAQGV
ncbi:MAG: adenylate/guanylate cyclase domain-containing protein, partial [Caldilineaceae bacterium]